MKLKSPLQTSLSLSSGIINNNSSGHHNFNSNSNSPQHVSTEPPISSSSPTFFTSLNESLNINSSDAILNTNNLANQIPASTSFNKKTILTRSAAVRQKQQQLQQQNECKSLTEATSLSFGSNSKHRSNGHSHQCGGKIVKPIPVHPLSSSASSTHSSTGAHRVHTSLQSILQKSEPNDQMPGFSLIAKYFASFPATRLKNNNQELTLSSNNTVSNSVSKINTFSATSQVQQLNTSLSNQKMQTTRFLPFKQSINHVQHSNQLQEPHNSKTKIISSITEKTLSVLKETNSPKLTAFEIGTTGLLYNKELKIIDSNLQQLHCTDHLCTNFKRLIKLTDTIPSVDHRHMPATSFATISRSPSNTPSHNEYESRSDSDLNKTRLGQIQMETRSTRKFLIKHHPYLQFNNQQQKLQSEKVFEQRPSINFIKMKRLKRKAAARAVALKMMDKFGSASEKIRASTRSSRVNSNSNQDDEDLLASSTPLSSLNHASKISNNINPKRFFIEQPQSKVNIKSLPTGALFISKSNRSSGASISSLNSNEIQPVIGLCHMSEEDALFYLPQVSSNVIPSIWTGDDKLNEEEREIKFQNEQHSFSSIKHASTNKDLKIEEIEEQSSGYYSSYQSSSIDIISSSGGSNRGDILMLNRQRSVLPCIVNASKPLVTKQSVNSSITPPHHHYHTRLSNFLHHQTTHHKHHQQSTSESKLPPPCTRLRHHQQMLAAAAANGASSIDLDLDLIEND